MIVTLDSSLKPVTKFHVSYHISFRSLVNQTKSNRKIEGRNADSFLKFIIAFLISNLTDKQKE